MRKIEEIFSVCWSRTISKEKQKKETFLLPIQVEWSFQAQYKKFSRLGKYIALSFF